MDFEKAAENVFNIIYPEREILECFSILKNVFLENQNNRRTIKNLVALAFVPPNHVVEEFL